MTGRLIALGISLATVPFPMIGLKLFFPITILLALLVNKQMKKTHIFLFISILVYILILILIFEDASNKHIIIINLFASLSIFFISFNISMKDWIYVGFFHSFFFIISMISLYTLNADIIVEFLYGESRHAIGAFSQISFRPSGLYQEPSTFSYHLLVFSLIIHFVDPEKYYKEKVVFLIISMLSFSVAGLISALILFYLIISRIKSLKTVLGLLIIIVPVMSYIVNILIEFLFYKYNVYISRGFEETTRFEPIYQLLNNPSIYGLSPEILQSLVLFDLGPIASSILIFGVFSLPLLLILIYATIKKPLILGLFLTKIALTNPLLWYTIKVALTKKTKKGIL